MIFNKNIVIRCKAMDGGKVFVSLWNIENIIKNKISTRGTNQTTTDLTDSHTCAAGGVHQVGVVILVTGSELL